MWELRFAGDAFSGTGSPKGAGYNHIANAVKFPFSNLLVSTAALVALSTAAAQQPLVLLDPARGGPQGGAHIADRVEEKQVTLQVAQRLASLLRARGFAVEMTREGDVDASLIQRAALANTTHPIACLLLHAAATGQGVHLFTTTLPQPATVDPNAPVPWDGAQAAYAARSQAMAEALRDAFARTKLGVTAGTTWTRPMDNMQCPAVVVEMGPLKDGTGADDPPYQNKVADTLAGTMLFWRNRVGSMTPSAPPKPEPVPPSPKPETAGQAAPGGLPKTAGTPKPAGTPKQFATPTPTAAPKPAVTPKAATEATLPATPKPVVPPKAPVVPALPAAPKSSTGVAQ